mmetsp:Transcript_29337/g.61572  ORF Transcript_29337/g.61572 Transcript_29337/m.61572 type:complete len:222 (-) Transcript_29337:109-774(-)
MSVRAISSKSVGDSPLKYVASLLILPRIFAESSWACSCLTVLGICGATSNRTYFRLSLRLSIACNFGATSEIRALTAGAFLPSLKSAGGSSSVLLSSPLTKAHIASSTFMIHTHSLLPEGPVAYSSPKYLLSSSESSKKSLRWPKFTAARTRLPKDRNVISRDEGGTLSVKLGTSLNVLPRKLFTVVLMMSRDRPSDSVRVKSWPRALLTMSWCFRSRAFA